MEQNIPVTSFYMANSKCCFKFKRIKCWIAANRAVSMTASVTVFGLRISAELKLLVLELVIVLTTLELILQMYNLVSYNIFSYLIPASMPL